MNFEKKTFWLVIKIFFFGLLDALAVWSAVTLFVQQSYKLLAILLIGIILLNYVYLSKRTYPWRYILPGTLFMLILVVYPLLYSVYISFTNNGTGHILSKEQVIQQLEDRYFLPDQPVTFNFTAYKNPAGEFLILFRQADGGLLLGKDGTITDISSASPQLVDSDGDGEFDKIHGHEALAKGELFKNLAQLQKLEFNYDSRIVRMKNFNQFAVYQKQYRYDPEMDVLLDIKDNIVYKPVKGYFTSPEGESLIPGFRAYIGRENYGKLLTDERVAGPFFRVFRWTVIWAFISVVSTFSLGLLLAILLNDKKLKLRAFYRVVLVLPYAIPVFIAALVWHGLFDTEVGIINEMLRATIGTGIPWLTHHIWAKVAVIIVNLWLGFPYMMIVCLGSLQSVPDSYYEAAAIDGASYWQQFRHITFPLLLVSVAPLLISSFAFNFNNFSVIYLFNRGRPAIVGAQTPAGATDILISYTYRLAFESGRGTDFGLASAVTVLIFIITATITWFNFRYTGALEEVKENV